MKKLFVPIVALATMFVFTSCGDVEKPEITYPIDDLTINLGDKTAALVGVTAKDKKNDLTDKIDVTGLDYVGKGELTYSVSNDAGETKEKRSVTIKADKLVDVSYIVAQTLTYDDGAIAQDGYPVKVVKSTDPTKLVIENLGNAQKLNLSLTFVGDGKTMTLAAEPKDIVDNDTKDPGVVTGTATYKVDANNYVFYECNFKIVWKPKGAPEETDTYVLKLTAK